MKRKSLIILDLMEIEWEILTGCIWLRIGAGSSEVLNKSVSWCEFRESHGGDI
jgi:hypothetical protein